VVIHSRNASVNKFGKLDAVKVVGDFNCIICHSLLSKRPAVSGILYAKLIRGITDQQGENYA